MGVTSPPSRFRNEGVLVAEVSTVLMPWDSGLVFRAGSLTNRNDLDWLCRVVSMVVPAKKGLDLLPNARLTVFRTKPKQNFSVRNVK